jgi:hypothetical protein
MRAFGAIVARCRRNPQCFAAKLRLGFVPGNPFWHAEVNYWYGPCRVDPTTQKREDWESQIVPEIAPARDEIVVTKTTDSALTGTNLRLILHNLGISHVICCGMFTDQCVSSTVRSLADECTSTNKSAAWAGSISISRLSG